MPREVIDKFVAKFSKVVVTMPSGWKMALPTKLLHLSSMFNCLSLEKDKTAPMIEDRLKIHDAMQMVCKKHKIALTEDFKKLRDNPNQTIDNLIICLNIGVNAKLSKNAFSARIKDLNRALGPDPQGRKIFPE